jgi:hypothetical protein
VKVSRSSRSQNGTRVPNLYTDPLERFFRQQHPRRYPFSLPGRSRDLERDIPILERPGGGSSVAAENSTTNRNCGLVAEMEVYGLVGPGSASRHGHVEPAIT